MRSASINYFDRFFIIS